MIRIFKVVPVFARIKDKSSLKSAVLTRKPVPVLTRTVTVSTCVIGYILPETTRMRKRNHREPLNGMVSCRKIKSL